MLLTLSKFLYCPYVPHPIRSSPVIKLYRHRCSMSFGQLPIYGYISMAAFYLVNDFSPWIICCRRNHCTMSSAISIYTISSLLYLLPSRSFIITRTRQQHYFICTPLLFLFSLCLHPHFILVIIFAFVAVYASAGELLCKLALLTMWLVSPTLKVLKLRSPVAGVLRQPPISVDYDSSVQNDIADGNMWFDTAIMPSAFGTVYRCAACKENASHSQRKMMSLQL